MGGHNGGSGGTTYKRYTIYPPKRWHVVTGKGLCAIMWFWVFYRAKQDGPVLDGVILGKDMMTILMVMAMDMRVDPPNTLE
ncbi:hypothetical protein HPP92_020616 [Vanilla planifolia]|uniref:Uncharacterized protein n=1 Tax=Vanilla planifolia TaxID=51239 RepID=A0A835PXD0_VANPL|nr:hypothetical protein HPP92_020616 [Vanilla planifolia]